MMRGLYIILLFLVVEVPAFAVPKIGSWTENGARVLFIEAHELPIVDVRIVFSAGAARDGDKPGLATLSNSLLMSGAGGMNADTIALRLESVGAAAGTESLRDMAIVSMRSLSDPDKLEVMTEVMRAVLTQPTFPAADLERERKQLLTTLEFKKQQPEEVAEEAFYKLLYGAHPYGSPAQGTPESVSALTREQIVDFYRRYYVAQNAVVAVVGDMQESGARELVKNLIGALPAGEAPAPIPEVTPLTQALRQHIDMPTVQTHVLVGQPGVTRDDPDYFPLYVGNHILGGSGFESRLMDDIREKRGLAYSVYSYFLAMARPGPFIAGMQTRNEQAANALGLMNADIKRFIEEGPTAEELQKAVQNITGGFALRIDSNKKLVEQLAVLAFYGLPLDYLDTFNDRVRAVTVESIHDAFRRRLDASRMVTITVGGG
ncbi:MAG TPA: pitrilysin family protein [Gammaproteobacteria bacterium]|nr:pitrilysin family protein [Gammaproteobacteria bacterium]